MSDKQDKIIDDEKAASDNKRNSGLVAWFHGNHAAANILMLFFLIAGLFLSRSIMSSKLSE